MSFTLPSTYPSLSFTLPSTIVNKFCFKSRFLLRLLHTVCSRQLSPHFSITAVKLHIGGGETRLKTNRKVDRKVDILSILYVLLCNFACKLRVAKTFPHLPTQTMTFDWLHDSLHRVSPPS